ncbi:hypothetical protein LPJ56_002915 [Coemansia sp. RSA 2599]|nr:hypothetical protein LPJ56_002915 [Coemansia sp. RSA 2599]
MATQTSFNIPAIILETSTANRHEPSADAREKNKANDNSMELCDMVEDDDKDEDSKSECTKQIDEELTKAVENMFKQKKTRQPNRNQMTASICGSCRQVVERDQFYFHISRCKSHF